MASLDEVLSGLGSCKLSLDWSPDTDEAAVFGRVLRIWQGEELIWAGPLLTKTVSKEGIDLQARSHEYWLGLDEDGPVIEDREFVAGTNKLSNPGAELDLLYWRTGENSKWTLDTANERSGAAAFRVVGDPAIDDILESDESFEAEAGQEYGLTIWAKRLSGTRGILRGRLVCEGKFNPSNLLPDPEMEDEETWANVSTYPADVAFLDPGFRIGPTTVPDLISNYDFTEGVDGLEDWTQTEGTWEVTSYGPWGEVAFPDFPSVGGRAGLAQTVPVEPNTRYRVSVFVADFTGTDGNAYLQVNETNGTDTTTNEMRFEPTDGGSNFQVREIEVNTREDTTQLSIFLVVTDQTAGTWLFTLARIQKIEGNTCQISLVDPFQIIPGRSYRAFFETQSELTQVAGDLKVVAQYVSAVSSRDDVYLDVGSIDNTEGFVKLLDYSLNPPSGYDFCYLHLIGKDIYGGGFVVGRGVVLDNDNSTRVIEAWSSETEAGYTQYWEDFDRECPEGTERIHVEIVAEEGSAGWVVDDIELRRVNATISTTADVIDYLCRNPNNGAYLVTPGTIEDTALPYDQRVRNMTSRTYLKHFSRAVMLTREWRITPENVLSWGTPEALYDDRTDFVLKPSDVELLEEPVTEESAENSLQNVKVIGAELHPVGNRHSVLEAIATVDPGDKVDYFGTPWDRTRLVSDATVDHIDYAVSLAEYEAARSAENRQSVRLRVSDTRALERLGGVKVGDWIYVYAPDAGLVDGDNEMSIEGEVVWPKRVRLISRSRKCGNGFRAEIRTSDNDLIPLENVQWENETTAEIEVGDWRPEFVSDPMGGAAGGQFMRYRASSPR